VRFGRIAFAMLAAWCLGCGSWERGTGDEAGASLRPNVLVIVVDTLRADHLSTHGYFRRTSPTLDRLAEQSLVFDNAFTVMNHTLPAHLSLVTGVDPTAHGILSNRWGYVFGSYRTLAERLREHGYATAAFVSGLPLRAASGFNKGFEVYEDTRDASGELQTRVPGERTTRLALRWLVDTSDRPFFLFVHYFDTHPPYVDSEGWEPAFRVDAELLAYLERMGMGALDVDAVSPTGVHLNGRRAPLPELVNAYDNQIRRIDGLIAQLLAELERMALADETLLVVTSDHGEGLGQHGYYHHGFYLYEEQLRIPLIVRPPKRAVWKPGRIRSTVSLLDVPLTILALVGAPADGVFHGQPLPLEPDPSAGAPRWVVAQRRHYSTRDRAQYGRFSADTSLHVLRGDEALKYLRAGDGAEELYDLAADPGERHNLARDHPEECRRLAARLDAALAKLGSDADAGERTQADPRTEELLDELGYLP
jgi:arylsulfatase A-like enzyme